MLNDSNNNSTHASLANSNSSVSSSSSSSSTSSDSSTISTTQSSNLFSAGILKGVCYSTHLESSYQKNNTEFTPTSSANKNKGALRSSGTNYYFVAHENVNANGYSNTLSSTMNNTPSTISNSNSNSNSSSNYISTVPKFSRSDSVEKPHHLEMNSKTKYYSGDTNIPPSQAHHTPPIVSITPVGSSLTASILEFNTNSSSTTSGSYITNNSSNSTSVNSIPNPASFNLRSHIDIRKPIDKSTAIPSSPPINIPPKAKMGEYIKSQGHASSPTTSEGIPLSTSKSGSVAEQKLDLFRGISSVIVASHNERKF